MIFSSRAFSFKSLTPMPLSLLEEDERVIQVLEELDSNFSSIRVSLRDMRMKIARVSGLSKQLVKDCTPWVKFFEVECKVEPSPLSELQLNSLKLKEITNSPDNLSYAPPRNPFLEAESSDVLNKSILKNIKYSTTDSSSAVVLAREGLENYDNGTGADSEDFEIEIRPFDASQIPSIFQAEKDLFILYEFVKSNRVVSVETIATKFSEVPPEKLEIFISLLCRKRFIKQRNGMLTIDK